MKIQDIVFFIILLILWFLPIRNKYVFAGICSLILAIPLFYFWMFFTAERLTWYAVALFFIEILVVVKTVKLNYSV